MLEANDYKALNMALKVRASFTDKAIRYTGKPLLRRAHTAFTDLLNKALLKLQTVAH